MIADLTTIKKISHKKFTWFFNSESYDEAILDYRLLDELHCMPTGFKANWILAKSYTRNTTIYYYDFNNYMLKFKRRLIETWNGYDYPEFISGYGFKPDLIWLKNRDSGGDSFYLMDVLRGVGSSGGLINCNNTGAEWTSANYFLSFDSDGWTSGSTNSFQRADNSYIAWGWKAGGVPSAADKKKVDGTESNLTSGTDYSSNLSNVKQSVNSTGFEL